MLPAGSSPSENSAPATRQWEGHDDRDGDPGLVEHALDDVAVLVRDDVEQCGQDGQVAGRDSPVLLEGVLGRVAVHAGVGQGADEVGQSADADPGLPARSTARSTGLRSA